MSRPGRRTSSTPPRRWSGAVALVAALAAVTLVGCAGGDEADPASGIDGASVEDADQSGAGDDAAPPVAGPEESASDESGTVDRASELSQASLAAERRQIMTAGLVVETGSVLSAARQAESIAVGAGGFVTDEDTQVEQIPGGAAREDSAVTVSSLTVRVPPTSLDEVLGQLAALGTLVSQNRATTDVTDEYVDVEARLTSQRASLDRLLQLVGTAGDLDDVIALENEIARRQADLDGLAARLQSLEEQTDLATIALTLTSEEEELVLAKTEAGFLAGLEDGWQAFTGAVVAGLTVVGALLPFAVLAALIAIPFLVARRRRGTGSAAPEVAGTSPPAAQA